MVAPQCRYPDGEMLEDVAAFLGQQYCRTYPLWFQDSHKLLTNSAKMVIKGLKHFYALLSPASCPRLMSSERVWSLPCIVNMDHVERNDNPGKLRVIIVLQI